MTTKLVGDAPGLKECQVNDSRYAYRRQPDGKFHVRNDENAKLMVASGHFTVETINFQGARSYPCPICGRENLLADSCGRCGWQREPE